jgi:hypothetical protein
MSDPEVPPVGADSDLIFGSTVISAGIFRFQNTVIDTLVRVQAGGQTLPYVVPAAQGTGSMTIFSDPGSGGYRVELASYNDPDVDPNLALITGEMIVVLHEISPGLRFTINPGEDDVTIPFGHSVNYQLPADIGDAARLDVFGSVTGDADAPSLRHEGYAHETGTLRIQETTQGILIIEHLALEFEYDPELTPSFVGRWPLGSYEVGIFSQGTSLPIDVTFDGNGGASFPYRGGVCNVNLADPEFGNPCLGT